MRRAALLVMAVAISLSPSAGWAHGDLRGTDPADGSTLRRVPSSISITLTEAPTGGPEVSARDGCKRKVPAEVSVDGNDIVLSVTEGEPGRWNVAYRAVSSVDGHQTRGKFAFTVSGQKDCSRDDEDGDDIDAGDNPGIVENPNPPEEGGTSWLVWVGGGTLLAVAAALVLRRASR